MTVNSFHRLSLCMALLIAAPAGAAKKEEKPAPPRPETVKHPSWGKVSGWVLDASTRKPVAAARVSIEVDGAFPETGKSTDRTDAAGRFDAKAPLGKISSKFDWGRALTMHPISLLISPKSVTKQTRIVDVSQVNARVEADGYRPFVGRVRARLLDASRFAILLDDVWLAPEGGSLVSFSPERIRMETIESLAVEPAIAEPGQKVKVTLVTHLPVDRGHKYLAFVTSTRSRLVKDQEELKAEKAPKGQTRVVWSKEITLSRTPLDRSTEIGFFLIRDQTTVLRQRDRKVLLQVVTRPEERRAAEKVAAGYALAAAGERDSALREYDAARSLNPRYPLAQLLFGDAALLLNRPRDAAAAYKELVALEPSDYQVARSRYAKALLATGDFEGALKQLDEAEKQLGAKRTPAEVFYYRARAYAAQGNFAETDKWLAKAGSELRIPEETQNEINLKRMEAAVKASPLNPDLRLSYARVLANARFREEAVQQIRKAVELEPQQPWAFIDLGEELWQVGEREQALANFKHAVALAPENAEALASLADAYRDLGRYEEALPLYKKVTEAQKMNLRARHSYALMLYAAGALPEARRELVEVVSQARDKGDLQEDGLILPGFGIYFGPKRRLVEGFSIPEAAADMAILEALQDLERHPESGLLWQNIGSALLDLGLPVLAVPALEKARSLEPALTETPFLLGLAQRKLGQAEQARRELEGAIAANPLHPRARLELAQLLTDQGRLDEAQAQLLAHSRNYPSEGR